MTQFLMEVLEQCVHEPMPVKEMADRLGASRDEVLSAVNALRQMHLATADKRTWVIRATPRGRQHVKAVK